MALSDRNTTGPAFWANLAAEQIYNTPERRQQSVEALKTLIAWAFTLFSVGGFALNLFGTFKEFSRVALICFGLTFLFLTIAYYLASKAQFPDLASYIPGDISQIQDAFNASSTEQSEKFETASIVTGIGFSLLAVGLLIQFATFQRDTVSKPSSLPKIELSTSYQKVGDSAFLPITVQWLESHPIKVTITAFRKSVPNQAPVWRDTLLLSKIFHTDTAGRFFYSQIVYTTDSAIGYTVRVSSMIKQNDSMLTEITVSNELKVNRNTRQ